MKEGKKKWNQMSINNRYLENKKAVKKSKDDARKLAVSYTANTCSQWHLHNTKRKDLIESTSVVPVEYPPKVKLELLTTLEC